MCQLKLYLRDQKNKIRQENCSEWRTILEFSITYTSDPLWDFKNIRWMLHQGFCTFTPEQNVLTFPIFCRLAWLYPSLLCRKLSKILFKSWLAASFGKILVHWKVFPDFFHNFSDFSLIGYHIMWKNFKNIYYHYLKLSTLNGNRVSLWNPSIPTYLKN